MSNVPVSAELLTRLRAAAALSAAEARLLYEAWVPRTGWRLAAEAVPLLVGCAPDAWPALLADPQLAADARILGSALAADLGRGDAAPVTPLELRAWAARRGLSLHPACAALLDFVARTLPPGHQQGSAPAGADPGAAGVTTVAPRPAPLRPAADGRTPAGFVLVTGASRGIGAATARAAAARGWYVGVNYARDAAAAQAVCTDIEAAGGRALALAADVSDEPAVAAMFARIDALDVPLTALVNNAGVVGLIGPFTTYTVERMRRTFDINILGSFLCAREAVQRMAYAHGGAGGAIVNLSSAAARIGSPNEFIDYAASKGAIDAFTLGLAKEYAEQGIRVNAVRPGIIDTGIHAAAGAPDRVERFARMVPLKRAGTVEEVAAAILWLLSPESSYTTGSFVDVTGGR